MFISSNLPRRLFLIIVLGALLLVACGSSEPDEISVQLSWIHEYSSAGFYAAEENGHFAEQNLQVSLVEGGFSDEGYIDPIAQVLDGTVDFGMTTASSIIQDRAEGRPVVAIASVFQRSPLAFISLAENDIIHPEDLIGKRVSVAEGGSTMMYEALLASEDIDPADVELIPRTTFGIDPLINGDVDVLLAWIINEGVQVEEAGYEPNFILLSDYAIDSYNFVIFTTEDMITNQPDMVERFLRAVVQGLNDVIGDPEQATEFTLMYGQDLDSEQQLRRLLRTVPLISAIGGGRTGDMQADIWEFTQTLLLNAGLLEEAIDLDAAYTLEFLDAIYAE